MQLRLPENAKIVPAINPQTAAGAKSGDWVSLKNYERCAIIVMITQGASDTTAITVDKATAVDGTGNSDGITINHWWELEDYAGLTEDLTKGTAAASITSSATGSAASLYVIDIAAEELGAYDCIQVELGASSGSNVVSALYLLYNGRWQQATPLRAISD